MTGAGGRLRVCMSGVCTAWYVRPAWSGKSVHFNEEVPFPRACLDLYVHWLEELGVGVGVGEVAWRVSVLVLGVGVLPRRCAKMRSERY